MLTPTEILSEKGPIAAYIDNFSVRLQQQQFAEEISEAIKNHESLVCEAGTGTGKTFAYLISAILSNKKIIISTGTKHLQDQLFHRDLPVVLKALDVLVAPALLKGRNNYLCLHRMKQVEADGQQFSENTHAELMAVREWSIQTNVGDLTELATLSENSILRPYITSTTENCLGKECNDFENCFVFKARKKASEAELIVVNHHLLLADLALKEIGYGEILPKADVIIFDEAHKLPELASEFFSQSLSSRQIFELINDCRTSYLKDINDTPDFLTNLDKLQTNLNKFRLILGHTDKRMAWNDLLKNKEVLSTVDIFKTSLNELENALDQLSERSKSLENCWQRCGNYIAMFETFIERETDSSVQWVEIRGKGFLLHQTPLDISEIFQLRLTEHECQCIYTSATLAVGQDFKHFANRLGLTDVKAKTWSSPFDYLRQTLLYLPIEMPDPRQPNYISHVINNAIPVIKASQGHTFFLFTSHRALNQASKLIRDKMNYPVMVQGEAPRTELLRQFRETENAVLLGTQSFWEGVDVKGQALSCVIIDKLPFAPPDDPVFRARSARMEENGQNPFMDYQLPEAIINLRQGVGRLIRDVNDYGVLMICDPRLQSKPYGQKFINSLPEMKMTNNIAEVELFFKQRNI